MKASPNRPVRKSWNPLLAIVAVLMVPALLTGCARPGDEDITTLLGATYECKWLEVSEYRKTDSLPGLWTYVVQYSFQLKFKDGEAGARNFNKGWLAAVPSSEKDLHKALQSPQVQEYMLTDCSEPSKKVLEQLAKYVVDEVEDKTREVRLPLAVPMTGWAEMSKGRAGWEMDVRRDKISGNPAYTEPMKWEQLSPRITAAIR